MSKTISVKFPERDLELVHDICMHRGEDVSSFLRRAARMEFARLGYLTKKERKALGV